MTNKDRPTFYQCKPVISEWWSFLSILTIFCIICKYKLNVPVFSVLKVCFESLRNVFISSDDQFGFKRGLSSSHGRYL